MADTGQTVNARNLANLFDLTERRIQQLAKEGVIPKASHGKYPFLAAIKAYIKFLQARVYGEDQPTSETNIGKERARLVKANADTRELELAVMRQEYLPRKVVQVAWEKQIASWRTKALAVPIKMAAQLHGVESKREIQAIARQLIYEALEELAQVDERTHRDIAASLSGSEGDESAEESGDGRVGGHVSQA